MALKCVGDKPLLGGCYVFGMEYNDGCRKRCKHKGDNLGNLEDLVNHYITHHRKRAQQELLFFQNQPCLAKTVELAARSTWPCGRKHPHQRRVPNEALKKAASSFSRSIADIENCRSHSFKTLLDLVECKIKKIVGIGDLTVYDTALRIGAKLGVQPEAVYLHAGTREGAKALGFKVPASVKFISWECFPQPLQNLKPREIEDFLCIYKDAVNEVSHSH